jgi:fructose/tagatose bisphosphate aldolase
VQNYGSLDSFEPAKVTVEKNQSAVDASILLEIDRTMKKHMDNLHHVLEGVSARLTQVETRTHHLESSMDDLKVSVGNNHGITDGKLRLLENILSEVFYLHAPTSNINFWQHLVYQMNFFLLIQILVVSACMLSCNQA